MCVQLCVMHDLIRAQVKSFFAKQNRCQNVGSDWCAIEALSFVLFFSRCFAFVYLLSVKFGFENLRVGVDPQQVSYFGTRKLKKNLANVTSSAISQAPKWWHLSSRWVEEGRTCVVIWLCYFVGYLPTSDNVMTHTHLHNFTTITTFKVASSSTSQCTFSKWALPPTGLLQSTYFTFLMEVCMYQIHVLMIWLGPRLLMSDTI